MKNISPQLLGFLQTHKVFNKADLFLIELANGAVLTVTNSSRDILFGQANSSPYWMQTYYASRYGAWQRGSVTTELAFTPKSSSMELTVLSPSTVLYPGSTTSLTATVVAGLFDKAKVTVYTVYWPIGEQPTDFDGIASLGYLITFVGQISKVAEASRSKIMFEVADLFYLLNTEIPRVRIQSSCRHVLFDQNCTLNRASFALPNFLASGSTTLVINLANALNTASFWNGVITFVQGSLVFTSGKNVGITAYIKQQNSLTQVQLDSPLPFPVSVGDALTLYPGCNLSVAMCQNGFNNLINVGAEPYVPNPEVSL